MTKERNLSDEIIEIKILSKGNHYPKKDLWRECIFVEDIKECFKKLKEYCSLYENKKKSPYDLISVIEKLGGKKLK